MAKHLKDCAIITLPRLEEIDSDYGTALAKQKELFDKQNEIQTKLSMIDNEISSIRRNNPGLWTIISNPNAAKIETEAIEMLGGLVDQTAKTIGQKLSHLENEALKSREALVPIERAIALFSSTFEGIKRKAMAKAWASFKVETFDPIVRKSLAQAVEFGNTIRALKDARSAAAAANYLVGAGNWHPWCEGMWRIEDTNGGGVLGFHIEEVRRYLATAEKASS